MNEFISKYQWDIRPKQPLRPTWFKSWPKNKRMAFQVIVLHEWESVPWHRSRPFPASAHHKFDYLALGSREYGARHGIWRLLDTLDEHGVKATVTTNGLVADLFPDSVYAAAQRGHELSVHQWDQSVFPPMFETREAEKENLRRAKDAIECVSKHQALGYMSPGPRPTPFTMEIAAELGFTWTCDFLDSDFPYLIDTTAGPLVAVSYATPGSLDYDLLGLSHPDRLNDMKFVFDAVYAESAKRPMRFSYAVHAHWGGTAAMARVLAEFLEYVLQHDEVWLSTFGEVAEFWLHESGSPNRI